MCKIESFYICMISATKILFCHEFSKKKFVKINVKIHLYVICLSDRRENDVTLHS